MSGRRGDNLQASNAVAVDGDDLNERQGAFAAAIFDPGIPIPFGLIGPDHEASAKRFTIYRNNVVSSLIETLKAAYPATRRLVGDEFFSAMARTYARRQPPRSSIMLSYGEGFADFIAGFEPAAALPYLRDVARLERAWLESYHAAEAPPIEAAMLAGIAPKVLPQVGFVFHPSVRVVRSSFPAVTLWRMNVDGGVPSALDIERGGEDALVIRPFAEVEVRVLPAGSAIFIEALMAGSPMTQAIGLALGDQPGFDLAGTREGLLDVGAIAGWTILKRTHSLSTGGPRDHNEAANSK